MKSFGFLLVWLAFAAIILSSCGSCGPSVTAPCDCTEYPFKPQCDSQCGMSNAVIQSVQGTSITIKTTPTKPGERAQVHTIPVASVPKEYLADLKQGAHVQMLYSKVASGGTTIKSIKPLSHPLPK